MDKISTIVNTATKILKEVSANKHLMKTLMGTYSNGDQRSLPDMISGEILSPDDRLLITERMKEIQDIRSRNKKKKKKNKKKNKSKKSNKDVISNYFD